MEVRQIQATEEDRGPLIKIAGWIMLVAMILTSLVKIVTKIVMIKKLQLDDYLIFTAMLLATGYIIAIDFEVDAGLGRHETAKAQDGSFEKAALAADILYVVVLCLGRLAVANFLLLLSSGDTRRRRVIYCYQGTEVVWAFISVLVLGFQCAVPRVWLDSSSCIDRDVFWIVFGVMNTLFDFVLALLPHYILRNLHLTMEKKLPILRVFWARLFAVPLVILRIPLLYHAHSVGDFSYSAFNAAIVTSIHITISVIISCIPFLKPILDSLQTGILAGEIKSTTDPATALSTFSSQKKKKSDLVPGTIRSIEPGDEVPPLNPWQGRMHSTRISGGDFGKGLRTGSMTSREPMIIKQTTTVTFEEENLGSNPSSIDDRPGIAM